MKSRNKSILLVDYRIDSTFEVENYLNYSSDDLVILDPENLFSELDWTLYEDDVQVINTIYSRLFEDVVMNNKKLVCFWPLHEQFGNEWFELATLCANHNYEVEISKMLLFFDNDNRFSEGILRSWKSFIYFLLESLLEDIELNEQFDEIATLKSDEKTIILFKVEKEGTIRYSFASDTDFLDLAPHPSDEFDEVDSQVQSFATFTEMLERLLKVNDLSLFESKFVDGSLEKAYFSVLSKEFKTKNLIENWIKTYSMN